MPSSESGAGSPAAASALAAGAPADGTPTDDVQQQVLDLLAGGQKIAAIKLYRQQCAPISKGPKTP